MMLLGKMNSDYNGQKWRLKKEIFGNEMTGKEVNFEIRGFRKYRMI